MKFECIKCGFGFESSKKVKSDRYYTCPNCGGIILYEGKYIKRPFS
jgi:DNA-directed RNA polymerase subunit RPC12/RpoP